MVPIKTTLVAAGVLALTAGTALSAPAVVSTDLNLRSGPGTGYGIVGVMPSGSSVDAYDCTGGWCQVEYGGQTGYASRNYLDIGRADYGRPGVVYTVPRYERYSYVRPFDSYAYAPQYGWRRPFGGPFRSWNW